MVGTVQDITDSRQAEREHRIAETLQRSLLPERLPDIPGVTLAARYVPATADMEVGGDWYDVVQLANGHVGLAIGDVAGHGLRAASTMGQLRMALRAYALEEESPAAVVNRVHQLVQRFLMPEMVTLVYAVFDPETGTVRYANAGHPPPLVVEGGAASYLDEALAPPLGAMAHAEYGESAGRIEPGSTLLLFTDGLVERRGVSIRDGLARLQTEATGHSDLEALCDHLLSAMVGAQVSDDVALLALRRAPLSGRPLRLRVPAEPNVLASLRQAIRRWLAEAGAGEQDSYDILIACGEACANAVQHAYGARDGSLELEVSLVEGAVEVAVRDAGTWRPSSEREGGQGLHLMHGLMDSVEVESGPGGTMVRMRRRLAGGGRA